MTVRKSEFEPSGNRFSDNTCGHTYGTGRRRGVVRAAWWPCHNSYLERVFRANGVTTRIGRMAKRGAPEPDPDPDSGPDPDGPINNSAGPFLGAVAVIVAIVLIVFGAQFFGPSGEDLTDRDLVYRAVADYVAAHNADDREILERLRCGDLEADEAPLADVEGTVDLQAAQNITIE